MKFSMIFEAVDKATQTIGKIQQGIKGVAAATGKAANASLQAGKTAAKGLTMAAVGMSALLGVATADAMAFESSMADVNKVVEFQSPEHFAAFGKDILTMSTRIPMAVDGLAAISAEAGAAGIALEDNLRFTEFTAKSAVAFDMAAANAGDSFAKIRNVYGLTQTQLEGMSDAVNHLSNNMASKAPQIIDFMNRAGGAAPMLGASATEMAAIGSAIIATGTAPEVAGRGITALATKLEIGGKGVDNALKSIGLSHTQLMAEMQTNPGEGLVKLFEAVNKSENGTNALKDLVGQDFVDDFAKLANRSDLLAQSLNLVGDATNYARSVQGEFATRAATTANSVELLQNNTRALGVEVGSQVLPYLNTGLTKAIELMQTASAEGSQVRAAFEALVAFFSEFFERLKVWVEPLSIAMNDMFAALSKVGDAFASIMSRFTDGGEELTFAQSVADFTGGAMKLALETVNGLATAAEWVLTAFDNVIAFFQGSEVNWAELFPPIAMPSFDSEALQAALNGVVQFVSDAWSRLQPIFEKILGAAGNLGEKIGGTINVAIEGAQAAMNAIQGPKGVHRVFEELKGLAGQDFSSEWGHQSFQLGEALTEGLASGAVSMQNYRAELTKVVETGGQYSAIADQMLKASQQLDAFSMPTPKPAMSMDDIEKANAKVSALNKAAKSIPTAISAAMVKVNSILSGVSLIGQGERIMLSLATGMERGTSKVVAAVAKATQKVRDHLPSSPAKTGPLSDIHRLKFGETIAQSINAKPMVAAMRAAAGATMAAAALSSPVLAQAKTSNVAKQYGARASQTQSSEAPITINYQPTMHLSGGAQDAQQQFADMLKQHASDIEKIVAEQQRLRSRRNH